jgi:isoquinoline 1-oxidoreductase beta subunit
MTVGTRTSRRTVLKGAAGLVIGMHLGSTARSQSDLGRVLEAGGSTIFVPNAFVRIGTDNVVTVIVKHIEFGQGPFTGLSTLVAEELDADWSQMRAEHAPANATLYNNLVFGPVQGTGGSSSIANSYEQMRKAGAIARELLVQAAANDWNVPASQITVERGVLRHVRSGRSGRFGQFAEAAAKLPVPADAPLKPPSFFRLIGRDRSVKRLDSAAKSNGTAKFTIDIREPSMLTVVVAHPPRFGAEVASFDASAARAVSGVVDVKQTPQGVAVFANGMWPAIKGREKLRITWDETAAETRGSDQIIDYYRELARTKGIVAAVHGDAEAALSGGGGAIEAEYVFPYLAHAPMEPLDGFLRWDGQRATARIGCQLQTGDQMAIATVLGIKPEQVEIETMPAGGSFGRRGEALSDFAQELAGVAKAIGPNRPVKLVWTREDDIQGGRYRPTFLHRMRGAIRDGQIVAWTNTVVGQSFLIGTPWEAAMVKDGIDDLMIEGAKKLPYEIANFRCDVHVAKVGVPTLSWRSVGHTHTGYAVECFVDELLQAAGKDPIAGRLAMMGKSPRQAGVLRAVAQLARWSGPGPINGRARGVAIVEAFGTYVAQIAEVSAGNADGPRVHKVWCAVDCGVSVNPDVIRAQMEGGIGSLVQWAWTPGLGRAPAPGTNAEFGALLEAWAATGAHCPRP